MNSLIAQDETVPALSVDELGDRIVAAAGRIAAATSAWLLLVAEFDRREGYASYGLASTAQWLSWACGLSHRTAVEHVRVAGGLAEHPRLATEMSQGRLSFSQVRAITRIAEPGNEELIDSLVMAGTERHVETLVQGLRTVQAADEEQPAPRDYLRHSWHPTGQLQLSARLDPEAGAILTTALYSIARADALTPAQALARMAEIALAAINDRDTPPRTLRGAERAAIAIHIDENRLTTDEATGRRQGQPPRGCQPNLGPPSADAPALHRPGHRVAWCQRGMAAARAQPASTRRVKRGMNPERDWP